MGLGLRTNNYVELMALKLLLFVAKEKEVSSLQIFGDSILIINWIRNTQRCHNTLLSHFLDEIFRMMATFYYFSIQYVNKNTMRRKILSLEKACRWILGHG
jgi:ribonuclease HI